MALSYSTKMVSSTNHMPFIFLAMMMLIMGVMSPISEAHGSKVKGLEWLKVPSSYFRDSIQGVIHVLQHVSFILSRFPIGQDFRLSNAISDCLDLLDLSFDALQLSSFATETPIGIILYLTYHIYATFFPYLYIENNYEQLPLYK